MRPAHTIPRPLQEALVVGLRWLHTTAQPPRALLRHGIALETTTNRTLRFCPAGPGGRPVITVDITRYDWRHDGTQLVPTERIGPTELAQLSRLIRRLGGDVSRTQDGYPNTTGTLLLRHRAHPTLLAAVKRYRDGCAAHRDRGTSCSCGWYEHGTAQLIHPTYEEEPTDA